jgi:sulfite exporter TauE/SafE
VLFLLQPLGGLLHHRLYLQTGGRTPVSHLHIWLGRAALICGIINGGLGLKLSQNTTGGEIAFGVVAGVMMLVYALSVLVKRKGARGQKPRGEKTRRAGKWEREERMIERDAGSSRSRR